MASTMKPTTGAFVLDGAKAEEFFSKKWNTCADALARIENRKNRKKPVKVKK